MSRGKDGSGVVTTEGPPTASSPTTLLSPPKARRKEELESRRRRTAVTKTAVNWGRSRTTSKKQAAYRGTHRPSGQPTTREEPWGKATWWLSLAQTKGKARASQGQRRPLPPPSPSGRERVKDCRQTAKRLSAGPSAAKPDGVAVTPKGTITNHPAPRQQSRQVKEWE